VTLTAQKFENRLLAHHFFPRIAKRGDEFPPCFVSGDLTQTISNRLQAVKVSRPNGYGAISLRATRFDLAPRNMEVLHPRAYAELVRALRVSWSKWSEIKDNRSSALRMTDHQDGRVFSMIEHEPAEDLLYTGGRFKAKVDISNFYGSIYTHSIPWAVYGTVQAKRIQDDKSEWTNVLDMKVRQTRRTETTGISIGPGTSAIIGEIILGAVDKRLQQHPSVKNSKRRPIRFIDDYEFVSDSRDEAEDFVRAVRDELSTLKLSIHPTKTTIVQLPKPLLPRWMRQLRLTQRGPKTLEKLLDLLDQALDAEDGVGEEGELRYALVAVEGELLRDDADDEMKCSIADRLLNIGYLRPVAVASACRILNTLDHLEIAERADDLDQILQEHVANGRTDSATWAMYSLIKADVPLSPNAMNSVVASRDCLALALLTLSEAGMDRVEEFLTTLESRSPMDYERDEYWLLYYLCALDSTRFRPAPDSYYLELKPLLDANVRFIDLEATNNYKPYHKTSVRPAVARQGGTPGGRSPYAG